MRRDKPWQQVKAMVLSAVCGMTAGAAGVAVGGPLLGAGLAFAAGACCGFRRQGVADMVATVAGLLATLILLLAGATAAVACAAAGTVFLGVVWLVRNLHDTWRRGYDEAQRAYQELILPRPLPFEEQAPSQAGPYAVYESRDSQLIRN